ncbi:MAG: primosomal protein N' [Firmicutes bacterium]|nr:primosomal protein N' [Bacillota bacterium]
MFAKVIVDIKHEEVNHFFDYIIPEAFRVFLERGMRVIVPFGAQTRMGYVVEIIEKSDDATKEIIDVMDAVPSINEETFLLIDSIMAYAPNLYSSIFSTVLSNALQMDYNKEVTLLDANGMPQDILSFFNTKGIWRLKKKDQIFYPRLKKLVEQKLISIRTVIKQKGQTKTEINYTFNEDHDYPKIDKYPLIMDLYMNKAMYSRKELIDLGVSPSQISTLEKHRVLLVEIMDKNRDIVHQFKLEDKQVELNKEQIHAVNEMKSSLNQNQTFLLKGVTGSGKTEVYLNVIEQVIKLGRQVLVLVPEITLIAPMAQRLKSRFSQVAIYHSALSKGERFDQYKMIEEKEAAIVLGTRSSVFLPLESLGLIIIDEEHDASYEQSEGVFYDAKLIAQERTKYHHIPLILGSATPSIVSMYKALNHEYELLELTQRPLNIAMPKISLVDMKKELELGNTSIFSTQLLEAMKNRLDKHEQTMLLFNRKGYAPFVLCKQCGDVPKCPHCDISLTYYKDKGTLKCHYCGFEKPFQSSCEVCGQNAVKEVGVGIEYVEHALQKALPHARILRMDANVTTHKGSHEIIWNEFMNEKADILLGTQMIAKGLDFPKVTLVGILMADLSLKVPSYKASEQAYMLFTQVSGRSGRLLPGQAIIQGYDLDHYAIKNVLNHYEDFYREAIYYRKLSNYLPFKQTAQILIEGHEYLKTYQQAFLLRKRLVAIGYDVLGPTPAMIKVIKDQFRFTLTLKYDGLNQQLVFDQIKMLRTKEIEMKYYPTLDHV